MISITGLFRQYLLRYDTWYKLREAKEPITMAMFSSLPGSPVTCPTEHATVPGTLERELQVYTLFNTYVLPMFVCLS